MNAEGYCYLKAIIFKLRSTSNYRDVAEIMRMRGVQVDHATIQRWVYKFSPFIVAQMKKRKLRVSSSWRMDETYIKVKGQWCYLYRAIDKLENTVDFLLTKKRQKMSAHLF